MHLRHRHDCIGLVCANWLYGAFAFFPQLFYRRNYFLPLYFLFITWFAIYYLNLLWKTRIYNFISILNIILNININISKYYLI